MGKSLLRSTALVSAMTSLSRILGFMRDMLVAQLFGATPAIDAFYVAFRVPNFMRGLFAEGAFAQAFVPVLSEYRRLRSVDETRLFIQHMQGSLLLALSLVMVVVLLFTPAITSLFAPGFIQDPQRFALTTEMLRITFPYLMLISLTAFYGSVLNTYGMFGVASFTPVLLNVIMIAAALWLAPYFNVSVMALAWGVLIAGICQFIFQLPFMYLKGLLFWPRFLWRDEGVKRVMKLLVPALFGVSVAQISLLIDTLFASFLPTGSITWLYYANRLAYFPLGIFGVALATVILPHLSRRYAEKSSEEFSKAMDWALRCILVIAIPSAVGLYTLAIPLFITLFQYGHFHLKDALMSGYALQAYALGLPAFMLVKVLASGFYSRQNIKTPVRIAVLALVVNMLLNFALIGPLKHVGLALASTLSSTLNAGLLFIYLIISGAFARQRGWVIYLMRLLGAGAVVCGLMLWLSPAATVWNLWSWQHRVTQLLFLLLLAVVAYFACLAASGLRVKDFRLAN